MVVFGLLINNILYSIVCLSYSTCPTLHKSTAPIYILWMLHVVLSGNFRTQNNVAATLKVAFLTSFIYWLCAFIMSNTCWEWIYTLYLSECQGTLCSKLARYLKVKWTQRESNPQQLFRCRLMLSLLSTTFFHKPCFYIFSFHIHTPLFIYDKMAFITICFSLAV